MAKKSCEICQTPFTPRNERQRYCSQVCGRTAEARKKHERQQGVSGVADLCSQGTAGTAIEMLVAARLMLDGWNVFVAASPHSPVDLIVFKDGVVRYLECRSGCLNLDGRLNYPKAIRGGFPTATEYAVYIHTTKDVHFVPVPLQ